MTLYFLQGLKMIGIGEGGVLVCNSDKLYKIALQLASRNAPKRDKNSNYWDKYYYDGEGYNYLLPHLLGAVGRAQIERFPEILNEKVRVGKTFIDVFKNNKSFQLQFMMQDSKSSFG